MDIKLIFGLIGGICCLCLSWLYKRSIGRYDNDTIFLPIYWSLIFISMAFFILAIAHRFAVRNEIWEAWSTLWIGVIMAVFGVIVLTIGIVLDVKRTRQKR